MRMGGGDYAPRGLCNGDLKNSNMYPRPMGGDTKIF